MNWGNEENKIRLEEAIIKTIAFFDLFDYPLTDFEAWKWLWGGDERGSIPKALGVEPLNYNVSLWEVKNILESDDTKRCPTSIKDVGHLRIENNILESKNGFYFLRGREETVRTRMERYNYAGLKFKRAVRVAKFLRLIPWIKMIAVGNIIGAHNMQDKGDIDLFIIARNNCIWITRFFSAVLMAVLNLRPQAGATRDKICLSFFVSEEAMNLEGLMLENPPLPPLNKGGKTEGDIYFVYWLAGLVPIYEADDVYSKFVKANSWLKNYLPNWRPIEPARWRRASGMPKIYSQAAGIFGFLEPIFKMFQLKFLPAKIREMANKDTRVVISDNVLKFHTNDRREEYRKRWKKITNYKL